MKQKHSLILLTAILLAAGPIANSLVSSISSTSPSPSFAVPCQIQTYGKAWEGTLAFGLFDNFSTATLSSTHSYLVVMKTNGEVINFRESNDASYWAVKQISSDELLFQGEPGAFIGIHIWNLKTNQTTDLPDFGGHHDIEYNPETKTYITPVSYERNINGTNVLYDKIVEFNSNGSALWSWDTYSYFTLDMACPFNDTWFYNGQWLPDITHTNSVQWDYKQNIIYLNIRNLNTFCAINKTSGELIWSCGEHGNFKLLDNEGQIAKSLWYHSHALKQAANGVFEMFDNEFHNQTNPQNANSRIIDITVNLTNKTAYVSWSWTAPKEYWTPYWGEVDRLPNGDRLGTFGSQTHSIFWNSLTNSSGAVLVEVNPKGEIVRTYTFPEGWGIYRAIELNKASTQNIDVTSVVVVAIVTAAVLAVAVLIIYQKNYFKKLNEKPVS